MWDCYYCTWEIFVEERISYPNVRTYTGGVVVKQFISLSYRSIILNMALCQNYGSIQLHHHHCLRMRVMFYLCLIQSKKSLVLNAMGVVI